VRRLRAALSRLLGTWPSQRREREFAEELESHLQMHVEDNLRAGMPPDLAEREARLRLGGVDAVRQDYRERAGLPLLEHAAQDLRFAVRQLTRSAGFTFTAVLLLALGMGASTALFGLVDAALIQPLPYGDPGRLVSVMERIGTPVLRTQLSHPDFLDWKRLSRTLASIDVSTGTGYMLDTPGGAELAVGTRVSSGFFHTLGVVPRLGRDFHPGEDAPGEPPTVILSYTAWQKRFGGSDDVLGRTAVLSGVPHTIVGVLPRDFQFAPRGRTEFWAPLQATSPCDVRRSCHSLSGIGRLRDGVSVAAAEAELRTIALELERLYPDSNRGQGASVVALSEALVGDVRPVLLLLFGGAALLLLIALANMASLLLVRSEGRRREIAVRGALGASRGRLVRQFLTEGLVLVGAGSVLGLALASLAMRLLVRLVPPGIAAGMPYLRRLGLSPSVLAFACAVAVLAALLFSVTPLLRLPAEMREGLTESSRGSSGTAWRRLGSHLIAVELAVAVVLLASAGLLGQSFRRLLRVDVAFAPDHLATMMVAAPPTADTSPDRTVAHARDVALARQALRDVARVPGVVSVGLTSVLPVSFNGNTDWIRFVGRPYSGEHNEVNERDVSADYFTTLRARLVSGRFFTDAEDSSQPLVVVINRALARRYFSGEDPIGKRFGDTDLSPRSIKEIVGIVDDIREGPLDSEIWPAVYYPFNQNPDGQFFLVVRTAQDERSVMPALHAAIRRIDPGLGITNEATMADRIDDSPSAYLHRSSAGLIGAFAALALLLGVVGLYGVIAYSVSQRSREIGVRMALGAQRGAVYRLVLTEAGRLTATGIGAGLAGAIGAGVLMRTLLFETAAWDPQVLGAVAAILAFAALLASYIPARRAASVDPIVVLRAD
jgi:macrolide transport system ATP-binding/permease protein